MSSPPIVVALDVAGAEEAVRLARDLEPHVGGFKIGLGLLHGPGPGLVAAVGALGRPVFADAKLHDIPTQVETAARRLAAVGARWITAHVSGGGEMLRAAVAGAGEGCGILGVTVLTSLDEAALTAVGIRGTPGKLVARMARVADDSGCEGVVCSPRELGVVATVAPRLAAFSPGIRPAAGGDDDQRRTATAPEAIRRGARWLVVGRPITAAPDPVAAAAALAAEIPV